MNFLVKKSQAKINTKPFFVKSIYKNIFHKHNKLIPKFYVKLKTPFSCIPIFDNFNYKKHHRNKYIKHIINKHKQKYIPKLL